jgi:hypothetical protein
MDLVESRKGHEARSGAAAMENVGRQYLSLRHRIFTKVSFSCVPASLNSARAG